MKFVPKNCTEFLSVLPFPVAARYDLELLHAHFVSKKGYDSKINDSIKDPHFMRDLRKYAFEIVAFSRTTSTQTRNRDLPQVGQMIKDVQDAFLRLKLI